jgi:hypothetical protein
LTLLDIPADQLRRHFDALATILRGSQLGLVVRGAFPADLMTKVVTRLERGDCLLRRYDSPYFEGVCCGGIVVLAGNDLAPYLEQGQHFRAQTAPLFEGGYEYQPRIEEILGAMAGGRPVTVPLGPDGRPYMPSSIRGVTPGSGIDLHCENETVDFPGMRHLSTVIDKRQQLSFYVTLGVPDAGGKIAISSLQHATGAGRQLLDLDRVSGQTLAMVDSYPSVIPELNPGDLLIFDAGRHYHRVLPVVGKRIRWTMGGFVAFSRDHSQLHYWS